MTTPQYSKPTFRFDFNEANIITETSRRSEDRTAFFSRLKTLAEHTSDPYLLSCVNDLMIKLSPLSDTDFYSLMEDAKEGTVLFPKDYSLPKTSEISLQKTIDGLLPIEIK